MSKVLLVDDAAVNRRMLGLLLRRAGHEVFVASDADGALRTFAETRPDAVLTDLHLGDGPDGTSLARELRRMSGTRTVRIGLMTGDAMRPPETDSPFDAVLGKPVLLKDLVRFLG